LVYWISRLVKRRERRENREPLLKLLSPILRMNLSYNIFEPQGLLIVEEDC
jgi:hypothetical protein